SPPPSRDLTPAPPSAQHRAQLQSLRKGLARSRNEEGFFGRLKSLLGGKGTIDADIAEEIEEVLLTSDVGVQTTEKILDELRERLSKGELNQEEKVWDALRARAKSILEVEGKAGGIELSQQPTVVLFVGVNGAGKTTTIGKLAQKFQKEGKSVMLSAGDTFRAAAVDQLKAWGDRIGVEVVAGKDNADPSSVLFDSIDRAKEAGVDVLLADTAGRLHTKTNLMQEMSKIAKTANKALEGAPHEVLLVIDSTNGQNAMAQAKEFREALPLSGLVMTKLDGTARGGVVLGICDTLQVPVRYIGVGESPEDLHDFDTGAFVEALLGGEN
ncbi:MAG: signal recognition particle-docking protein FtsY, partial [Polyangiaceae bacterium]|nr:signal recognition particle-docking protein FtsY [Polyangiaceae bacterium]